MSMLTVWLTNIILLILLATILELMMPNSSMQRYVKMVVGILLLVIMLQPVLSILTEDVDAWLFSLTDDMNRTEQSIESSINLQKREIELGQRAYISEQVAVQLESQVEGVLQREHGLTIVHINVETKGSESESVVEQQIEAVHVQVQPVAKRLEAEEEKTIEEIEVIKIDTSRQVLEKPLETNKELEPVQELLSQYWQIPKETILVAWEGGKREE
ncbi:stage III sporulation protein AF [bacterium LRH843]|nr:stage III sporulation protein AF [bacterium LRH843]